MFYLLDEKRTVVAKILVQAGSAEDAMVEYANGNFVEISENFLTNENAVLSCAVDDEKQRDPKLKRAIGVLQNINSDEFKEKNSKRKRGKVDKNDYREVQDDV